MHIQDVLKILKAKTTNAKQQPNPFSHYLNKKKSKQTKTNKNQQQKDLDCILTPNSITTEKLDKPTHNKNLKTLSQNENSLEKTNYDLIGLNNPINDVALKTDSNQRQQSYQNQVNLEKIGSQPFLKSPLKIQMAKESIITQFTHESPFLGSIEINIEQIYQHTMHYHLKATNFFVSHLQAALPSLLQNLIKTLPNQVHHVHNINLKNKKKNKKQQKLIDQSARMH